VASASMAAPHANVSVAHSTFVSDAGNGNALALAPKIMGLRDRRSRRVVRLSAGARHRRSVGQRCQRANLTINNLLNSDWREAQFADTSAVTPTSPAVEQMHFTSGIPLTATATAAYQF